MTNLGRISDAKVILPSLRATGGCGIEILFILKILQSCLITEETLRRQTREGKHMTVETSRRTFLKFLPLAAVFASIGGAAFRFLRPKLSAATGSWLDVAPVPS